MVQEQSNSTPLAIISNNKQYEYPIFFLGGIWRRLEASGSNLRAIWEASGKHLGGIWGIWRHLSWRHMEASGSIWEASGRHLETSRQSGSILEAHGSIWRHLGGIWKHLDASGRHLGGIWSIWAATGKHLVASVASGKHLGGICEASGRHLGGIRWLWAGELGWLAEIPVLSSKSKLLQLCFIWVLVTGGVNRGIVWVRWLLFFEKKLDNLTQTCF